MASLVTRAQQIVRGLLTRHAPSAIKRALWDREFSSGKWDNLDRVPGSVEHPEVERYAKGGHILDVGCGPGSTGNELTLGAYASYVGVDISAVAVHTAKQRTIEYGRANVNSYVAADALTYVPSHQMDVILFGDSIYYIPHEQIVPMLQRYKRYLTPTGHIIVRMIMWSPKYRGILTRISSAFDVVELATGKTDAGVPVELLVVR